MDYGGMDSLWGGMIIGERERWWKKGGMEDGWMGR